MGSGGTQTELTTVEDPGKLAAGLKYYNLDGNTYVQGPEGDPIRYTDEQSKVLAEGKALGTPASKGLGTANNQSKPSYDEFAQGLVKQQEDAGAAKRQAVLGQTAQAIAKLNTAKGISPADAQAWEDDLASTLNDKSRPQEVNDVLALRKAYKRFEDLGVTTGRFGSRYEADENGGQVQRPEYDKVDLKEQLGAAEAKLRETHPQEWEKMKLSSMEEDYSKLSFLDTKHLTEGDTKIPGLNLAPKMLIAESLDDGSSGLSDKDASAVKQEKALSTRAQGYMGISSSEGSAPSIDPAEPTSNPLAEAKLRNEIAHGQEKIAKLKGLGMVKEAEKATVEYAKLQEQADAIHSARHQKLKDEIKSAEQLKSKFAPDTMIHKAASATLDNLKQQEKGFLDPAMAFHQAVVDNAKGMQEAAAPGDSPAQAMRKYYAGLIYERKQLQARQDDEELSTGMARQISGVSYRGANDDENRLKELDQKIKALAPVVLLNEMPETDKGFLNSAKGSFLNTLYGASDLNRLFDTNTAQGKAMAVAEMLQTTGINPETAINPKFREQFEKDKSGPAWFSGEHFGNLAGMIGAMAAQSSVGSGLLSGLGTGKILAQAGAAARAANVSKAVGMAAKANALGTKFGNVVLKSLHKGLEYEITGDIFKDQEHFFNFTTGLAGGLAEGAVGGIGTMTKAAATKSADLIRKVFGKEAPEAARIIMENGQTLRDQMSSWAGRRISGAVGAGVGQFAEGNVRTLQSIGGEAGVKGTIDGLLKVFQNSDVREKYHEHLKQQFGNTIDERVGFFFDMMLIGTALHGKEHGDVIAAEMRDVYDNATAEQRSIMDQGMEAANETAGAVADDIGATAEDAKVEIEGDAAKKKFIEGEGKSFNIDEKADGKVTVSVADGTENKAGTEVELNDTEKAALKQLDKDIDDGTISRADAIDKRRQIVADAFKRSMEPETKSENAGEPTEEPQTQGGGENITAPEAGKEPETVSETVAEPSEEPVVSPAPDQNAGTETHVAELGQTKPKVHERPKGQEPVYSFKINGHEFFVQNEPFEGKDYYSQVEKNENGDWKTIPDYDNARSTRKQAIDNIVNNWQEEVDARNKRNAGKEKPLEPVVVEEGKAPEPPKVVKKVTVEVDGKPFDLDIDVSDVWTDIEGLTSEENVGDVVDTKAAKQEVSPAPKGEKGKEAKPAKERNPVKRNRAGKGEDVSKMEPDKRNKNAAAASIEARVDPTPENKAAERKVEKDVSKSVEKAAETATSAPVESKTGPKAKESAKKPVNERAEARKEARKESAPEKAGEGALDTFVEARLSGKRRQWRKTKSGWQYRDGKQHAPLEETTFLGDWNPVNSPETIKEVERMAAMDPLTLDMVNAATDGIAAFGELITLKWGTKGKGILNRLDLGTGDQMAKMAAAAVKGGIAVAKKLVDNGILTYERWESAMKQVFGSMFDPHLAKAWEEVQKEHPVEEKKPESKPVEPSKSKEEKKAPAGEKKAETPEQKQIRELKEENAKLKAENEKKGGEPEKTDAGDATTGKKGTSGIWTTLQKYKGGKAGSGVLDKIVSRMDKTYGKVSHDNQFVRAMEGLGWNAKTKSFDGNPLDHVADLISAKKYSVEEYSVLLEKRLVMMDLLGKSLQGLEEAKAGETDPVKLRQIEDDLIAGVTDLEELGKALDRQGTIGGQGNSFVGFWRNMYTHADAIISAKIMAHNREWADNAKRKEKIAREREAMNEIREREANAAAEDISFTDAEDAIAANETKKGKPSTPKPNAEPKKTIAERKAEIRVQLKKANKNLMGSLSSGGLAGLEVLPLLVKYGKLLIEEKFVNFKAWAAKMREDNGKISDANLEKIWGGKDEETGLTLKEHAELELKKAASAPEGKKARVESLRQKIQKELKSTDPEDLITRLKENVGLTNEEALVVAKEHESPANLEKLAKRAEERKAAKAKADADAIGRKQQAYIDKKAAQVEESRRRQLEGKVADALKEFTSKQGAKGMEDLLKAQGLDDAQISEVMAARGTEFTKAGVDALKKASEGPDNNKKAFDALLQRQGLTDVPANEKSLRSKVQKAFDDHFKRKDDSMTLKERLIKDAGLTDAQAETVLKAEDSQLKEREKEFQAKIDALIEKNNQTAIRQGVRQAISDHFNRDSLEKKLQSELGLASDKAKQAAAVARKRLWDGKANTAKELSDNISSTTGLEGKELQDVMDLIASERGKTFVDRIMENTGLDRAEAEKLAEKHKEAFDKRAKAQLEARAKKLRTKSKGRRTNVRPMNDVDRALETITDRELTDADMNAIFKERLGFMEPLTKAQSDYVRRLGDQLANAEKGSILEHDAARHLDRFFDQYIPKDKMAKRVMDVWQGFWIAGMLSGLATTIKNVMSAATIVAFSPLQNLANWSEWNRAIREAGGLKGLGTAEGREKAIRLSPVMGAAVKYKALFSGHVWGTARRTAADIWLQGYMGTKFAEVGETALGRQMTVLERRAYNSFKAEMEKAVNLFPNPKWTPQRWANWAGRLVQHTAQSYAWAAKWSGRNLQMQDVFIRTIATEMQLADAFRRSSVETTKEQMAKVGFDTNKSYAAWVNFNLAQSEHPHFKAAVNKAVSEVLEHQVALGKITQVQSDIIKGAFDGSTRDNGLPNKADRKALIQKDKTTGNAIIPRSEMAQAKQFVRVRTRELLLNGFELDGKKYPGLAVSERAREWAQAIAKSQIFTEKRNGVGSMAADIVNKVKSSNILGKGVLGFAISPFVPFTTIIGNMVDTMADYDPLTAHARANNLSVSGAIRYLGGKNEKGEYKRGSSMMAVDPKADWLGWRLSNAMRDENGKVSQIYYEQMGRAWTGVHTMLGLMAMMNPNPYGPGIGVTYDPDDDALTNSGDEYSVFINGHRMFSYKEYPFLAAPFAFMGALHSYQRNPENYGNDRGMAARLWYAFKAAETIPLQMSVGEGASNAMNFFSDLIGEATNKKHSTMEALYTSFARPYLKSVTKALPWRWSAVEQAVGLLDPTKYSTQTMEESLAYFFEGPLYGRVMGGYKDYDVFGDEMAGNPIIEAVPFLEKYNDEVSQRPYRKFLSERDIVLGNAQNSATVRFSDAEESILGVDFRKYTPEEWSFFKQEAGKNFKKSLLNWIEKPKRIKKDGKWQTVDPEEGIKWMDSHVALDEAEKDKPMSQTEEKVRKLLTGARLSARKAVMEKFDKKSDVSKKDLELLYEGGNQYGEIGGE